MTPATAIDPKAAHLVQRVAPTAQKRLRLCIVADLLEERWPSMDLVAEMLLTHLRNGPDAQRLDITLARPVLARLSNDSQWKKLRTLDRFVNRFWDYPQWLRLQATDFDLFHVVDHSYAHVVHVLPPERTIVTCHDADAFLPLLDAAHVESQLPRALSRRVLTGMQRAAMVTCVSRATSDDLGKYDLIPDNRRVVIRNGVNPAFSVNPAGNFPDLDAALSSDVDTIDLLHVGTCIPRKRIDRLLAVFAAIREAEPRARLLKAGGALTGVQRELAQKLGVDRHIVQLPFLDADKLGAVYRHASAVLITSDREGFGLPIAEALACGTSVVATDLPVLREIGGDAVVYCPADDVARWRDEVLALLKRQRNPGVREAQRAINVARAATFSWTSYAASMIGIYKQVSAEAEGATVSVGRDRTRS